MHLDLSYHFCSKARFKECTAFLTSTAINISIYSKVRFKECTAFLTSTAINISIYRNRSYWLNMNLQYIIHSLILSTSWKCFYFMAASVYYCFCFGIYILHFCFYITLVIQCNSQKLDRLNHYCMLKVYTCGKHSVS